MPAHGYRHLLNTRLSQELLVLVNFLTCTPPVRGHPAPRFEYHEANGGAVVQLCTETLTRMAIGWHE